LIKNSGIIKNPTNLVGYFYRIKNSGIIKNPTNLVGFKKTSQNWAGEKAYLFGRTYCAFRA
jgi:hypothetical protein